ncbi:MAG: DUF3037 domain-containing protein [Candidatus Polarisedimenticolaceae bacterium]|nr:DUF3037 domain-containing protein [Candidatus Polarisedimenticolaceae bacterium]
MNKTACQYAIVRFTPFVETGEFANVGIVMLSANGQGMSYKLLTRRQTRVTHFFSELDAKLFKSTLQDLSNELDRLNQSLAGKGGLKESVVALQQQVFAELIRPRETILRFSELRTVLAKDHQQTLEKLYNYYVGRDFVTKQYRDKILDKKVKKWLYDANLGSLFTPQTVGDEVYHATFPFVQQQEHCPVKIIKPLDLGQESSSKILDQGGRWIFKLNQLKKRHALPDKVLFAVEGPQFDDNTCQQAFDDVVEMLNDAGATTLPYNCQDEIINFARA